MLDGKFSVYNNNSGMQPPPAEVKKASPINFKFESLQPSALSFDDELRIAMEKFHKAKQPSPTKEALKKWVSQGYTKIFTKEEKQQPKQEQVAQQTVKDKREAEPKPFKNPLNPYLKVMNEKKEDAKAFIKNLIPPAPKEVKPFENPLTPYIKNIKEKAENFKGKVEVAVVAIKNSIPDIKIPKAEIKLPSIQIRPHLEKVANSIEKPLANAFEKMKERFERVADKLEDLMDEIYEQIPFDKINEMIAVIQDFPQNYLVPLALWCYSFIPVKEIKHAFESGVKRIIKVATHLGNFTKRTYEFIENGLVKLSRYLMVNFLIPFSTWLESILRWFGTILKSIAKWISLKFKGVFVAAYRFIVGIPGLISHFVKRTGRLTLWIASKVS